MLYLRLLDRSRAVVSPETPALDVAVSRLPGGKRVNIPKNDYISLLHVCDRIKNEEGESRRIRRVMVKIE